MKVIDSHTEGEPTRMVIEGGPPLGSGSMSQRRDVFAREHDHWRHLAIDEPRGYDAIVGALLCEPVDRTCAAGLIFFNNAGYLGMCGHASIGAAVTLADMGRLTPGLHRLETPVGVVSVKLNSANCATVENVASRRVQARVELDVEGLGPVSGDVAWGGNWFFLCNSAPCALTIENVGLLSAHAEAVRRALRARGITGDDGAEIDHIEFFGTAHDNAADSRNFVLCPGGAYDRSPCGTGTSAKLACLAADGKLKPGQIWVQEGIVGGRFEACYRIDPAATGTGIIPSITGRAWVTSRAELVVDPTDPLLPAHFRNP